MTAILETTMPNQLETVAIIESIDAAIRVIHKVKQPLAPGSAALWGKLHHAEEYLDKQIAELLKPEPELEATREQ